MTTWIIISGVIAVILFSVFLFQFWKDISKETIELASYDTKLMYQKMAEEHVEKAKQNIIIRLKHIKHRTKDGLTEMEIEELINELKN